MMLLTVRRVRSARPFCWEVYGHDIRKDDSMGEEERAGRGVVKLAAVVALNCLDGGVKLRANIREKVRNNIESFRLKT